MSLDGILLIDKQAGWTSHDVVAKARRLTGQRKIGHTGTLDPAATGLLVLCLGQATRLVEYLTAHDKRYTGAISLGATTTTDDAEGEVLETREVPPVTDSTLRDLEARFTGVLSQRPPAFSALKVDGRRAYALARAGAPPEMKERTVTISRLALALAGPGELAIDVECGAGTYIRSLARDIGEAIGCGAHLASLRRERAGRFDVADAITLETLANVDASTLQALIEPMDEGLAGVAAAVIAADRARLLRQGAVLEPVDPAFRSAPLVRIYDADGEFVAVGEVAGGGQIRGRKVFSAQVPGG